MHEDEMTGVAEYRGQAESDAGALEDLIRRWNRMLWVTGIRPMFRRMLEVDLTLAESVVLRSLQQHPLTVSEVADCLYISQSAASRAVDRLVRDGFVSRQENPGDRRQKQLTLTPRGAALVGETEALLAERLRPVTAVLSPAERTQLRALMGQMLDRYATLALDHGESPCCHHRSGTGDG